MRLSDLFVRVLRAVRRQRLDCNYTEALIMCLLADGEWHNTTEVGRRTGQGVESDFLVLHKMRRRGLVEGKLKTKLEGNWWRLTRKGEEVLGEMFRRAMGSEDGKKG